MNKSRIDRYIPIAVELIKNRENKVCDKNNKVNSVFRGYISSFGASVAMGSLLSAVAFYSKQGSANKDRSALMDIILKIIKEDDKSNPDKKDDKSNTCKDLFNYVKKNATNVEAKEKIYDAAIAIKLALNLFDLKD